MRPMISYYGGKQRLASKLLPLIPEHKVYVEPFCGGAALLFAKPVPEVSNNDNYREVLNDKDERIITLYRVAQTQPGHLHHLLTHTLHSEAEYRKAGDIIRNWDQHDDIWKAWAVYVNIQQSFSNGMLKGWARSKSKCNFGTLWNNKINRLGDVFERLSKIYLTCTDALEVIDQFDGPNSFFYCDPPYVGTHQGHYPGYTLTDLQALVNKLDGIKGKFLLSTYPVDGLIVPDTWETLRFKATMSASNKVNTNRKREELVYRKREESQEEKAS